MSDRILAKILEILGNTREIDMYPAGDELAEAILRGIDAGLTEANEWRLGRNTRIMLALRAMGLGAQIETVVELLTWKDFESFVAYILSENGFRCVESFRRRGNESVKGMEIDVVGVRGHIVIAADAKMWGARNNKSSALKTAAENQKERTRRLTEMMDKLEEKIGGLEKRTYSLFPILVTWLVEEVQIHDGVPIVPVFKLNSFMLNLDNYWDLMISFDMSWSS